RQLVVKTRGTEPLLRADQVRARYNLWAILKGHIEVSEITLLAPDVRIVQEPDGKSNLDPILSGQQKTTSPARAGKALELAIRNVTLKNGHVVLTRKDKTGAVQK